MWCVFTTFITDIRSATCAWRNFLVSFQLRFVLNGHVHFKLTLSFSFSSSNSSSSSSSSGGSSSPAEPYNNSSQGKLLPLEMSAPLPLVSEILNYRTWPDVWVRKNSLFSCCFLLRRWGSDEKKAFRFKPPVLLTLALANPEQNKSRY